MDTPGATIIKGCILIFIAYIILFAIAKSCWLAIRHNSDPKELGCIAHTILFAVAFVIGIIILRTLQ